MTAAADEDGSSGIGSIGIAAADWAGDKSKLTHPIKTVKDKYELLPAFLKVSHRCPPPTSGQGPSMACHGTRSC